MPHELLRLLPPGTSTARAFALQDVARAAARAAGRSRTEAGRIHVVTAGSRILALSYYLSGSARQIPAEISRAILDAETETEAEAEAEA